MNNITPTQKKTLKSKILQLRKKGLLSYGKDLERQLKAAGDSKIKKAYKAYLEKEIAKTNERIAKIDAKLVKS